jgi:hypothetical protein
MKSILRKLALISNQILSSNADNDIPISAIPAILRYQIALESKIITSINLTSTHAKPQLRFYGNWIISLSDQIYHSFPSVEDLEAPAASLWSKADALRQILRVLDAALMMLKDYGKPIFDEGLKMPDYMLAAKSKILAGQYTVVHESLKDRGLPDVMLEILSDFYNNFSLAKDGKFSFKQVNYAFKLLRGLRKTRPHEDPACMISGLLVYLNFNKVSLLDFCKQWMKQIISGAEDHQQLHTKLTELKKEVYVQEQNPHWSYDPEHVSLKDHLNILLEAEIIHLENLLEKQYAQRNIQNNDYFIMDTTVKQLDLWADINVKLGLIPHHSALQVIKVITRYIRTPKSGIIPYDSARKKLAEIDDATVKGLHNSLSLQKHYLEKEYPHLF